MTSATPTTHAEVETEIRSWIVVVAYMALVELLPEALGKKGQKQGHDQSGNQNGRKKGGRDQRGRR